jgi:hypothetical protein
MVELLPSDQSGDRTLKWRPIVTAVSVSQHDIVEGTGSRKLFDGYLSVGEHKIIFSQPMFNITVEGASISKTHANYAILDVTVPGDVLLEGTVYEDMISNYEIQDTSLDQSVKPNVIEVKNATMVNSGNGKSVAERLYTYYKQRYLQTGKVYAKSLSAGNAALITTLYGNTLYGIIEKTQVDLANGYVTGFDAIGTII